MNHIAEYNHTKQKSPVYKKMVDKENSPVKLVFSGEHLCSPKKMPQFSSQISAFEDITNSPSRFALQLNPVSFDEKNCLKENSPIKEIFMKMKFQDLSPNVS